MPRPTPPTRHSRNRKACPVPRYGAGIQGRRLARPNRYENDMTNACTRHSTPHPSFPRPTRHSRAEPALVKTGAGIQGRGLARPNQYESDMTNTRRSFPRRACPHENGADPQQISSYMSVHVGLLLSINSIFHARFHFLSDFSLLMALSIVS